MKTVISSVLIVLALVAFCAPGQAQQQAYSPQAGYASPVMYPAPMVSPQQMPYLPMQVGAEAYAGVPMDDVISDCGGGCSAQGEGCGDSCGSSCGQCRSNPCCCQPKCVVFGEYLYLRPRDAEVAYAVPTDGQIDQPEEPAVQIGPTALVDFDYDSGFRAGFIAGMGNCNRIGATYTRFDTDIWHGTDILPPYVMHSLVSHPRTDTTSQQFLAADADHALEFELIDVDFSRIVSCGCQHQIVFLMGGRYAGLEQEFQARFMLPTNEEVVTTDIDFDGAGIRVGLDAEFYGPNRCCLVYARSAASFVAGEFSATYQQDDVFGDTVVYTDWEAGRIVSMLDLELGVGWTTCKGCCRLTAGYMVSGWFNTVNTDRWIKAVQNDNFVDFNDKMTFDGLVARAEFRF